MSNYHYSIMLNECLKALNINENGTYVDLTLGMAGHSSEILKLIPKGFLIGFDKDEFAIEESRKRLSQIGNNFKLIKSDFKNIELELDKLKVNAVDGIIADLGISSPQVDNTDRGFSYAKDARLDMRMDQNQKLDAHYIVNNYSEEQLTKIFINNADVKLANRVAKAIIENRPINTTIELANVVREAYPAKLVKLKNPNKAIFQAIRIEVNNEFESISMMLESAIQKLKKNGSLAVITFHSLEDRIVKNYFGSLTKNKTTSKLPINEIKKYSVKVINPTNEEINENNRSRSAKLRVLTRLI
ncbi:16S rRNA (cytosine(1402)-N(4))-methyltransferase RsmH [Mycoplasma sp. Mirounga ES2805-ORL]|uniref:16S rRNA (cytosine(1402)-N(4))-methyltransferase RsmH n=1 Tax=Mycoplasma sp. Mirounga ES2805-ORL TaxID=754514 RepID=UPI00197BD8D2|nr:16S rRNA (cytosine(1402)-N(4))-methyltransferase RsmH [Mycoplasma sp. Mirounga ES2805-ORL]QSF13820.1 16S rRNA (cytosine(1402)-N(4))-methyltransferase RsmH [Mycoplasma sp. Mirounga ES2805-ORL]